MALTLDILGLPHLQVLHMEDHGDHLRVQVASRGTPTVCPTCHASLHSHGSKPQQYIDTPMHGKPVMLDMSRRRFKCTACGITLYEPVPDIDSKRMMTQRAVRYVEATCTKHTFTTVGAELGITAKTVRYIFDDYAQRLAETTSFATPEVLGIDELKIVGDYRCMITNVGKLSIYDLLPTRKKADLLVYFQQLPDKGNIKLVTMDMWNVYRQVVHAKLPGRPIIADKFHVLRMANDGLERVRKKLRKDLDNKTRLKLKNERFVLLRRRYMLTADEDRQLQKWSEMFPPLGQAYQVKEAFFDIYEAPSKAEAEARATAWAKSIPPLVAGEFRQLVTALYSWWAEIFAWFDYKFTNAYTESVNRLAKDMQRMGRGYSFEVVRARLLTNQEARKVTTSVLRSRARKAAAAPSMGFMLSRVSPSVFEYEDAVDEKVVEYGPHIPTLCRLLEEGYFE